MVFTHTYIFVRIVDCAPLADDDVACLYGFSTEFLESKTLAL